MRNTVKNLSENAGMHISDTLGSRNEQNALLLIYKLYRELQFFNKRISLKENEYCFSYQKTKNDRHEDFTAKNLFDFTFLLVDFYYDILRNNQELITPITLTNTEKNSLLLVYRFYNESTFLKKKIVFSNRDYAFVYQLKKGATLSSVTSSTIIEFTFNMVEFFFKKNFSQSFQKTTRLTEDSKEIKK